LKDINLTKFVKKGEDCTYSIISIINQYLGFGLKIIYILFDRGLYIVDLLQKLQLHGYKSICSTEEYKAIKNLKMRIYRINIRYDNKYTVKSPKNASRNMFD